MKVTTWSVLMGCGVLGCSFAAEPLEAGEVEASLNPNQLAYEEIDISVPPPQYDFWGPAGVSDQGVVLGTGFDCDDEFNVCLTDLLAADASGAFSVVREDFAVNEVNGRGDAGGCVIDPVTQFGEAAIVRANGHLRVLPRFPDEVSSCVIQLSDNETALVWVFTESSGQLFFVVRGNRTFPFDVLGANPLDLNNQGEIAGIFSGPDGDRAFRFDARSQTLTVLQPVPPDPFSWGQAINNKGEVLGYSFVFNAIERIGKWNQHGTFQTHFVEGTPEFPTVSNRLLWNEKDFIVVSDTTDDNTYVIPEPGVRLDLNDLVEDGAAPPSLFALDVNDRADIVAVSTVDGSATLFRRVR